MVETGAQLKSPAPWSFSNSLVLLFPCLFFFSSPLWALEVPQMGQKKKGRIVPQAWGVGNKSPKRKVTICQRAPGPWPPWACAVKEPQQALDIAIGAFTSPPGFTVLSKYLQWSHGRTQKPATGPEGQIRSKRINLKRKIVALTGRGRPMADTLSPIGPKLSPMHGRTHTHTHSHKWLQQL